MPHLAETEKHTLVGGAAHRSVAEDAAPRLASVYSCIPTLHEAML